MAELGFEPDPLHLPIQPLIVLLQTWLQAGALGLGRNHSTTPRNRECWGEKHVSRHADAKFVEGEMAEIYSSRNFWLMPAFQGKPNRVRSGGPWGLDRGLPQTGARRNHRRHPERWTRASGHQRGRYEVTVIRHSQCGGRAEKVPVQGHHSQPALSSL